MITRSVGYQEEEDVDTFFIKVTEGDIIACCSDGLHGKVEDTEIFESHITISMVVLVN